MIKRKFFIHCYITDGWKQIYDEMVSCIPKTDSEIISVISSDAIPDGVVNPILLNDIDRNKWEFPTLKLLRNDCLVEGNQTIDYYYMHLKGVTHRFSQPVQHWRSMMLYFLTRDVEQNSNLLDKYDVLGCNFCPNNRVGNGTHFSGNFWVTRRKHISNLEDIDSTMMKYGRLGAEFWIGERKDVGRYFSFHQSDVNHYSSLYAPDRYTGTSAFSDYEV